MEDSVKTKVYDKLLNKFLSDNSIYGSTPAVELRGIITSAELRMDEYKCKTLLASLHGILGFGTLSKYSVHQAESIKVFNTLSNEGFIKTIRFGEVGTKDGYKIPGHVFGFGDFDKAVEFFKDKGPLPSDFKGEEGEIKYCYTGDLHARSFFHFYSHPEDYEWHVNGRSLKPKVTVFKERNFSDDAKKKQALRKCVSENFIPSLELVTGQSMTYCLGIEVNIWKPKWTPTLKDDTISRLTSDINKNLSYKCALDLAVQQQSILLQLYKDHGGGFEFLRWLSTQVEEKIFEDPGKYVAHTIFGKVAKDICKYS